MDKIKEIRIEAIKADLSIKQISDMTRIPYYKIMKILNKYQPLENNDEKLIMQAIAKYKEKI